MRNITSTQQFFKDLIYDYSVRTPWLVDGRKSLTKKALDMGISKDDIVNMRLKHISRRDARISKSTITHAERVKFIKAMEGTVFDMQATSSRYNCTGIDYKAYHRPTSNGKGWVLIAPDEPANNYYFEDALLFQLLCKKYCPNTIFIK